MAAADIYAALATPGPRGLSDRIQVAHCLKEAGRAEAAEAVYREAAAEAPLDADAQRQLGFFLRRQGLGAEAIGWLARALVIDPADAETREALAGYGLTQEQLDSRLLVALLQGPDAPDAHRSGRSLVRRWRARRAQRNPADRAALAAWLRAAPADPAAVSAVMADRLAADDAAGALETCHHALLRAPRSPELHLLRAQALDRLGRPASAAQAALAAWRLRPGWSGAAAFLHAARLGRARPGGAHPRDVGERDAGRR